MSEQGIKDMKEWLQNLRCQVSSLETYHVRQIDENRKISSRVDEINAWIKEHEKEGQEYGNDLEERLDKLEKLAVERAHLINYKSYLALNDRLTEIEVWT